MPPCAHNPPVYAPSEHAKEAGYKRATPTQLLAAAEPTGKAPKKQDQIPVSSSTFPAPLVLPGDELSWEPDYETQSLKSWIEEPHRNEVTPERQKLYVVPVPSVAKNVPYVNDWAKPRDTSVPKPKTSDVVSYLRSFYHPLPVHTLTTPKLQFVPWIPLTQSKAPGPPRIGLAIGSSSIGIRHRASKDDVVPRQLNLNDLLDAAIEILPSDAYALLMLVEHDLYEDEEDDFCCGRAYGGSRVAVVSMARYNPALDEGQEVEKKHAWPAAHCAEYVDEKCRDGEGQGRARKKTKKAVVEEEDSVLSEAVDAWKSLPAPTTSSQLRDLWLGRLCKTASHELGHCFGMDHCVYYACIMQGTAGLSEDARQPPYLCPVDLAKVLTATGADETAWAKSMLKFCEKFSDDRMFAAFSAWLKGRLRELENLAS